MIQIALLGFGTVGSCVYQILEERKEQIEKIIRQPFRVVKILVRNPEKYPFIRDIVTTDIQEIINNPQIDLVIELTGAVDQMIDPMYQMIIRKKHIISANKALISKYMENLDKLASENNIQLKFEAAVGGAIPILSQIEKIISLNDVIEINGVLNGTCNFILSKMEEGKAYQVALGEAQEIGFAEADPSEDVDGWDTLRKLRIVASLVFQKPILERDIYREGIRNISLEEIQQVKKAGQRYKLLARANKKGVYEVAPKIVAEDSLLGRLQDGENVLIFTTSNAGDLVFQGQGAGGRQTAFAVLSDLIDIYSNAK